MRLAANAMLGYAVIIARRQAGRRPVVVGAGVLDGGLARLPGEARVKAAVVGSTAAAVTLDDASRPAGGLPPSGDAGWSSGPGTWPRPATSSGMGFVVARFGWSLDDAISRDEGPHSAQSGRDGWRFVSRG